ncbi:SSU ribosomal protein S30P/sigma 54 modulation protein [Trichococcus flocculiformis]|nr:ribosomal protein s30ae/sigma 54 modulation protein [Trichococcus sp. ES5]SHF60487.1 SSU ribosomal protein S30P/sigma 54 modulation protein [Trichococcus flocculiformis]
MLRRLHYNEVKETPYEWSIGEGCLYLTMRQTKGESAMFKYNVRGENIEVTEPIRNYAEKKLGRLEKYFENVPETTAHVNLKVYPFPAEKSAKVEVTVPLPFLVLRAEETSSDLYGSIDLVVDKLERQVRKYKTKIHRKSRERGFDIGNEPNLIEEKMEDDENPLEIVRTKRLSLKPMDSEEAVLQMNMLGHNFFIFEDAETNGTSIVYRRKDGKFGLIETD